MHFHLFIQHYLLPSASNMVGHNSFGIYLTVTFIVYTNYHAYSVSTLCRTIFSPNHTNYVLNLVKYPLVISHTNNLE